MRCVSHPQRSQAARCSAGPATLRACSTAFMSVLRNRESGQNAVPPPDPLASSCRPGAWASGRYANELRLDEVGYLVVRAMREHVAPPSLAHLASQLRSLEQANDRVGERLLVPR